MLSWCAERELAPRAFFLREEGRAYFHERGEPSAMSDRRRQLSGHLLALFTVTVWGTIFISTKVLQRRFQPMELLVFRFALAWLVLFLCSPRPLNPRAPREELCFVGAGFSGLTLYFLLQNLALTHTLASNVGIILSAAPMFTALSFWALRMATRPRPAFFVGFGVAMCGIVLITFSGGGAMEFNPLGDLFSLGAALAWAAYSVFMAKLHDLPYTNVQATRKVFFWGLVCALPVLPFLRVDLSPGRFADPLMLGNLLFLAVLASAVCYMTWNAALKSIGSVTANVYVYLSPVITLIASAIFLGEPITARAVGAIALILAGLWLSQWRGGPALLAALRARRARKQLLRAFRGKHKKELEDIS